MGDSSTSPKTGERQICQSRLFVSPDLWGKKIVKKLGSKSEWKRVMVDIGHIVREARVDISSRVQPRPTWQVLGMAGTGHRRTWIRAEVLPPRDCREKTEHRDT